MKRSMYRRRTKMITDGPTISLLNSVGCSICWCWCSVNKSALLQWSNRRIECSVRCLQRNAKTVETTKSIYLAFSFQPLRWHNISNIFPEWLMNSPRIFKGDFVPLPSHMALKVLKRNKQFTLIHLPLATVIIFLWVMVTTFGRKQFLKSRVRTLSGPVFELQDDETKERLFNIESAQCLNSVATEWYF